MGLFNKNKNDEEYLLILSEIRDNIRINNDDVLKELENKITEAKHENLEEVGVLASKVKTLEHINKLQSEQLDENYQFIIKLENNIKANEEKITDLLSIVEKYTILIKDLVKEKEPDKKEIKKTNNGSVIINNRKYGNQVITRRPKPTQLHKDGKFTLGRSVKSKWDINTILKLKQLLQTECSFREMAVHFDISEFLIQSLCYMIETGEFEHYLKEWEQINADNYYNKAKNQVRSENDTKGRF